MKPTPPTLQFQPVAQAPSPGQYVCLLHRGATRMLKVCDYADGVYTHRGVDITLYVVGWSMVWAPDTSLEEIHSQLLGKTQAPQMAPQFHAIMDHIATERNL